MVRQRKLSAVQWSTRMVKMIVIKKGPRMGPFFMPAFYACLQRGNPALPPPSKNRVQQPSQPHTGLDHLCLKYRHCRLAVSGIILTALSKGISRLQ